MSQYGGEAPVPPAGRTVDAPSRPVRADPAGLLGTFAHARPMAVSDTAYVDGPAEVAVTLQGRAAPGPGGVLRAPLSGVECVWYRSLVFKELRGSGGVQTPLQPIHPIAPSDLPEYGAGAHLGMRRQELGSDRSSTPPFGVTDGRTTVLVEPMMCDVDTDIFGVNAVVGEEHTVGVGPVRFATGTFTGRELHTEWVIPVGAPVLAVGTLARGAAGELHLVTRDPDVLLVSTKPEQRILSRAGAATDRSALPLPLRSVRALKIGLWAFVVVVSALVALIVVLVVVP